MSDNIPLGRYQRKGYVVLMGLLQFLSMVMLYQANEPSQTTVTVLLFALNLTGAFLDVIVDALMVT